METASQKKGMKRYDKNNTWIVIPAYNEEKRLGRVIDSLIKNGYHNIAVVDDGSRDRTFDVAFEKGVWSIKHPINMGQGAALQTGIEFALKKGAEAIITFDADGQHRAEEIPLFFNKLNKGYDAVLGSRFLKNNRIPIFRKIILKGGIFFTKFISNIKVTDSHNGFRAITKYAASKTKIEFNDMTHASEILDKISSNHLRFCEVPVTIIYSNETMRKGQSSLNALKIAFKIIVKKIIFG